jgi:hypothetical protein
MICYSDSKLPIVLGRHDFKKRENIRRPGSTNLLQEQLYHMNVPELGRLERVELRNAWLSESGDFTPWLAQSDNLKLLGDAIDLDLELEAQEKNVGPFRADILCRDTASDDHWVLIENQLERTDHGHLGQLITYAAGLKAATIVWVAARFTDEHRAALDWLNEITGERFAFFGLEVELWRIGNSPLAPKFNIISKPNDWTKTIQSSTSPGGGELTNHGQIQLQFWTAFRDYLQQKGSFIRCQKPFPQNWMNHSIGRTGFRLVSVASGRNSETNTSEPEIRVELVMDDQYAKTYFAMLSTEREQIEANFGQPFHWYNPGNTKSTRVYLRRSGDFFNQKNWPELQEWLRANLEKMYHVFAPRIKQLDASILSEVSEVSEGGADNGSRDGFRGPNE